MIILEIFKNSDFKYLKYWINSEKELVQFAGLIFDYPLTPNQIEEYLRDEKRKVYKILYKTEIGERSIGIAELYDFSETTNKIARILIGDKSFRGKGIGTRLIKMLVKCCFEKDSKSIVSLNVYDWNVPAMKCYEKAGFTKIEKEQKSIHIAGKEWKVIEMQTELKKEYNR